MIKAIIFDLDDTLISELEYVDSGFWEVSKILSIKLNIPRKAIFNDLKKIFKQSNKNVFNRFLEDRNILYKDEDIIRIVGIYRNHKPNITFYNDVIPTINILKQNKIKVGIITDGYAKTQKLKLEALNAYDIFDKIIITDELGKKFWKPNSYAFELMQEELNVKYEEMMYVGDNPEKDFYISKALPIKCVRIYRKNSVYLDKEYKENVKESYKINSLNEILKIISNK